mmetsp:Transcript_1516/g.2153  ORF Transcript_1516/g.2153 Transcript_1516/m.2153 type:complete len:80 (+) Transcript_1516:405-644(+)
MAYLWKREKETSSALIAKKTDGHKLSCSADALCLGAGSKIENQREIFSFLSPISIRPKLRLEPCMSSSPPVRFCVLRFF